MPEPALGNPLLNPGFSVWDRGSGPFTASGVTANAWRLERTGGAARVSIAPGTTSTSTGLRKWIRNRTCMEVTVLDTYDQANDTAAVRQRIELGDRLGGQVGRLTVWATGPAGASFEIGVGGVYETITTRGSAELEPGVFERAVSDPSTSYQFIDVLHNPEPGNVFKLGFAQIEWRGSYANREPYPPLLRNHPIERGLISRHIQTIGRGMEARAVSTTEILVNLRFDAEMYSTPVTVSRTATPQWKPDTGVAVTAAGATYTIENAGAWGCGVKISGFTGLTAGTAGYLVTDICALLEAAL